MKVERHRETIWLERFIEPVTVSGAIRILGIVLVLCFIALLVLLGIEFLFFWEMDFIK